MEAKVTAQEDKLPASSVAEGGLAPHALPWRVALGVVASLALVFFAVWLAPPTHRFQGLVEYAPLHAVMETIAVAVSVLVFGVGWNSFARQRNGNSTLLACAFLSVAVLDVAHFLSYAGMPDFITPSGPEKAIDFWLAARFAAVVGLTAVVWRSWQVPISAPTAYGWLVASLSYAFGVLYIVFYHFEWLPRTFIPGSGLTAFKIAVEWCLVAVLTLSAGLLCWRRNKASESYDSACLFVAIVVTIFSGLCFTLYSSVTDAFKLLGHGYKIIAYAFIYRAVVVVNVRAPYFQLQRSEARVRRLNTELESRVQVRTAELAMSNKELESFSYSVSHDLRAPLRAIDGFSEVLLEDYGAQLDAAAKDYLVRIRNNTQRMDGLITALLKLSRLTRLDMNSVAVNLSNLVDNAVGQLKAASPERILDAKIAPNIMAHGDEALLQIAITNLIDNAWKYTSKSAHAMMEFGAVLQDGKSAYYVRDNGAGFDMRAAGKLFGAFQRMHGRDDFPGDGIGLATVARIVHRHGGRVWAESAPGAGATFYFTLGT